MHSCYMYLILCSGCATIKDLVLRKSSEGERGLSTFLYCCLWYREVLQSPVPLLHKTNSAENKVEKVKENKTKQKNDEDCYFSEGLVVPEPEVCELHE